MMNELVSSIMTKNVITLHPDTTLGEAREIMLTKRIHHLPVLEEGRKLVGIVTTWDFFKLGLSVNEYKDMKVKEVMTGNIAKLDQSQHIGAVAEVLLEHLFHAVPITDDENNLEGIVTSSDVLRYQYHKEYPENLDRFVKENM
ncbi:MAG: CBS domain-containing protein [Saprospiraceae bacterium]